MLEITGLDLPGVTETKLNQKNSDSELKIDGYKMERNHRSIGEGGGVMSCYKETLGVAPYLVKNIVNNIESMLVDINLHSQRTMIGVIDRPPDNQQFYAYLEQYLQNILNNRKNIIKFGMENMIKQPTRIIQRSRILLDLIITSKKRASN